MTREHVHEGRRAEDSLSRFKDRTVLVGVGLLGLVLLVFAAGMTTAYVRDSWPGFAVTSSERHVHAAIGQELSHQYVIGFVVVSPSGCTTITPLDCEGREPPGRRRAAFIRETEK